MESLVLMAQRLKSVFDTHPQPVWRIYLREATKPVYKLTSHKWEIDEWHNFWIIQLESAKAQKWALSVTKNNNSILKKVPCILELHMRQIEFWSDFCKIWKNNKVRLCKVKKSTASSTKLNYYYELAIKNKCTYYLRKLISVYFFELDLRYCNQVNSSGLMHYTGIKKGFCWTVSAFCDHSEVGPDFF